MTDSYSRGGAPRYSRPFSRLPPPPRSSDHPPAILSNSLALEAPVPLSPHPDKRSTSWRYCSMRPTDRASPLPPVPLLPPPLWVWCPRWHFQVLISLTRFWVEIETVSPGDYQTRLELFMVFAVRPDRLLTLRPHIVLVFLVLFLADCWYWCQGISSVPFFIMMKKISACAALLKD